MAQNALLSWDAGMRRRVLFGSDPIRGIDPIDLAIVRCVADGDTSVRAAARAGLASAKPAKAVKRALGRLGFQNPSHVQQVARELRLS